MFDASVVICTYNRPRLLEMAVRSCLRDASRKALRFEIVIADNSVDQHALSLVRTLAAEGHPIRSVPASPPNISIARNAGLHATDAPLVAFLDDDLEVESGWLDHFVETMAATGADGAMGPVRPSFEGGAPYWDAEGRRFTRVLEQPSGSVIGIAARAPRHFVVSTASSIWRVSTCFTDAQPFDPAYGASGGEDIDLFLRLEKRGCRFVWCADAGVRETIQPNRTRLLYQLLRTYSGAQVYAAVAMKHAASPSSRALSLTGRGAAQAAIGLLRVVPAALLDVVSGKFDFSRTVRAGLQVANGMGKLTWWNKVALYHVEKPHLP